MSTLHTLLDLLTSCLQVDTPSPRGNFLVEWWMYIISYRFGFKWAHLVPESVLPLVTVARIWDKKIDTAILIIHCYCWKTEIPRRPNCVALIGFSKTDLWFSRYQFIGCLPPWSGLGISMLHVLLVLLTSCLDTRSSLVIFFLLRFKICDLMSPIVTNIRGQKNRYCHPHNQMPWKIKQHTMIEN